MRSNGNSFGATNSGECASGVNSAAMPLLTTGKPPAHDSHWWYRI